MSQEHIPSPETKLTPMLAQYQAIKKEHPGCLLFFRLGDFYELFFEDAVLAAKAIDITLTKRGKHQGEEIPMCGVPFHAAESYIARLIRKGHKVAICEQLETPEEAKKRGYKAVVRRDVIRVITAGTLTEDALLEAKENNFLMAISEKQGRFGIAVIDISTGDFFLEEKPYAHLPEILLKYAPSEILLPQKLSHDAHVYRLFQNYKQRLTLQPDVRFDFKNGEERFKKAFSLESLSVFGAFSFVEISAAGALLAYVDLTQKGHMPPLRPPHKKLDEHILHIDSASRKNLEITTTLSGDKKGTLFHAIDRTVTPGGARLLLSRLCSPLAHVPSINNRLDLIEAALLFLRGPLKDILTELPDFERLLSRLSLGRAGPRDLLAIRNVLCLTKNLKTLKSEHMGNAFGTLLESLSPHEDLFNLLEESLDDMAPLLPRDGHFIKKGYHEELDALRVLRDQGRQMIAALQAKYTRDTGITALKIKHNNILGYYIEITATHKSRVPEAFIHRQTLANNMRFTTVELVELEQKMATATEKALAIELALFEEISKTLHQSLSSLLVLAATLNEIDVTFALGTLATEKKYVRPLIDEGDAFHIEGGRHPVVEEALERENQSFTANDCFLEKNEKLWLLTGPNMAGKSTFLRQNALIAILAHMGSFVPATSAHMGVIDRIFSRVGASDNLAEGHSTFMVEMIETATILHQATERSFVIMDEIGRGTATYDGVSIAWAVVEYLHHVIRCRSLFATHYHELVILEKSLEKLSCYTVDIKEWQGDVVFLHKIIKGTADRSYGIHVAELAGLPQSVIERASEMLTSFEGERSPHSLKKPAPQALPLFNYAKNQEKAPFRKSLIEEKLKELQPDDLSPKEALSYLYELKNDLEKEK